MIVGLGNPHRGDDAVGILVAQAVKENLRCYTRNQKGHANHGMNAALQGEVKRPMPNGKWRILGATVTVVDRCPDPTALLDLWQNAETVVLIDAVVSGAEVGKIRRYDARAEELPREIFPHFSTHTINLADVVELARTLNKLPRHLIVYGIEGNNFKHGSDMSPAVISAADEVAKRVAAEVRLTANKLKPDLHHKLSRG